VPDKLTPTQQRDLLLRMTTKLYEKFGLDPLSVDLADRKEVVRLLHTGCTPDNLMGELFVLLGAAVSVSRQIQQDAGRN
jgi:hypothetical protein